MSEEQQKEFAAYAAQETTRELVFGICTYAALLRRGSRLLVMLRIDSAPMVSFSPSAFDGARRQSAHEVFAGHQVDHEGRQRGDHGRGHVDVVFLDRT